MRESTAALTALIVLSVLPSMSAAQTCSCAAVPLLGSMQSASPKNRQWFLAGTYEFHDLSELVAGSNSIPDQTGRDRTSQALIMELSKGITSRWSASVLLSATDHELTIGGTTIASSGLGDAIAMIKYSPKSISLYSDMEFTLGIGARIPIGADDRKRLGVTLAEDLQPSVGGYASIAWAYWARALNESKGARVYASASYTLNSDNDRGYQFGDDSTVSLGGAYQTQSPWGFNLELMYRTAKRDQRDAVDIPNTGGSWLDIVPAVQYHITEDFAVKASTKIPISRDLNDELQFTTNYALRLSFSYVFGSAKD